MLLDEQIEIARDSGLFPCPFPFADVPECAQRADLHDVEEPELFCQRWQDNCENS